MSDIPTPLKDRHGVWLPSEARWVSDRRMSEETVVRQAGIYAKFYGLDHVVADLFEPAASRMIRVRPDGTETVVEPESPRESSVWISVEDRMPVPTRWGVPALVANDRGEVSEARYVRPMGVRRPMPPRWESGHRVYRNVVTHWMPLPAPPSATEAATR